MSNTSMEQIKRKMQSIRLERENAIDRAEKAEQRVRDLEEKIKAVKKENMQLKVALNELIQAED
jgi:hypothetical protein